MENISILKKPTGSITMFLIKAGEKLTPYTIPFETFVHVITGAVEIGINKKILSLKQSEYLLIQPHKVHFINALKDSKINLTIIKSGY